MSCHPVDALFIRLPCCIKNSFFCMKRTGNDYIKNILKHHVHHMFILLKEFSELLSIWRLLFTFLAQILSQEFELIWQGTLTRISHITAVSFTMKPTEKVCS